MDIFDDLSKLFEKYKVNFAFYCANGIIDKDQKIRIGIFTFTFDEFLEILIKNKSKNKEIYKLILSKYPEYLI